MIFRRITKIYVIGMMVLLVLALIGVPLPWL